MVLLGVVNVTVLTVRHSLLTTINYPLIIDGVKFVPKKFTGRSQGPTVGRMTLQGYLDQVLGAYGRTYAPTGHLRESSCESGPLRAVHLSRHKWPGGLVN